jgi:imidazolonepropionase-like amidohydrolase
MKMESMLPVQIWGVADQVGSVEKGKWADLIQVTGDPLEVQSEVKYVFIKGRETELASRQTKLYDKYASRP